MSTRDGSWPRFESVGDVMRWGVGPCWCRVRVIRRASSGLGIPVGCVAPQSQIRDSLPGRDWPRPEPAVQRHGHYTMSVAARAGCTLGSTQGAFHRSGRRPIPYTSALTIPLWGRRLPVCSLPALDSGRARHEYDAQKGEPVRDRTLREIVEAYHPDSGADNTRCATS